MKVIRIKYIKDERVKYVSHLETMNTFERAIRRSGLKLKYSQGFNPKMHIVFGLPLPVGVISMCEYADMYFDIEYDKNNVIEKLKSTIPKGFDILEGDIRNIKKNIMRDVHKTTYEIKFKENDICEDIVNKINSLDKIEVIKKKKKKEVIIDIKPLINKLETDGNALLLSCNAGNISNLHPRLFIEAIKKYYSNDITELYIKRTQLFVNRKNKLVSPLSYEALNEE